MIFSQCDTSRWKAEISPGAGAVSEVLDAQTIFVNGILTTLPSPSFPTPYYANFYLKDTFCITNNFTLEVKLKNDPSAGGSVTGDTWIYIAGSNVSAGCLLFSEPTSQPLSLIFVGNTSLGNLPELIMDLSSWRTLRFEFIDNVINWSYDGSNFFSLPYTGSICNIEELNIGFRDAGEVDYVKILDAYGTTVYYEEFNDCNNLAINQDCLPPTITASSALVDYCEGNSFQLLGSSNVSVQYIWTGPNGFSSFDQSPIIPSAVLSNTGWYK
ncbi:MAG: hypothetical protein H0V61_10755, partial [Chitinophagales bacterium]|nr:hypothetical protein [Chitinophagales bacterium]